MTDTREEVVSRHLKGMTNGQIAAALGLSRGTVGGHLYRWRRGPTPTPKTKPCGFSEAQDAMIRKLHSEGLASAEVGDAVGKSSEAVRKRGRALGLCWKDRQRRTGLTFTIPSLNEKQVEEAQRENDARLVRALAQAFMRGDHLSSNMRDAA